MASASAGLTAADPASAPSPSAPASGPTTAGPDTRRVSTDHIQLVQNLIERCLQLYMSQREVTMTLNAQAHIEPGFTQLVWHKLEEQNPDFFRAYYTRLKLKDQIVLFNHLLEQQVQIYHKIQQQGWVPPTVPSQANGHQTAQPANDSTSQPIPGTSQAQAQTDAQRAQAGEHASTSEAAALGEAEFHTMAGSLSTLLDHHHDSQLAHSLPLSASELNLASWSSPGPGPGDAGDLSGIPRNFSMSDLAFDHLGPDVDHAMLLTSEGGLPRICSLPELEQAQAQAQAALEIGAWTGDQPSIKAKMQGNDVDTEYMQKGNTQGTVSSESLVNGRPVHERQEDPEELTSGDFQSAAGGISGAVGAVQQSTASAVNYVKNAIMPSNTDDATRDPEVKEFTQAAGETTESFTTDDGSGSGPQTQTRQSVSAGESEGGQPQHSYGDMARNTAGAVQQKVMPRADAAPRDAEESGGSWFNRTRYDAADQGEKAADKTADWFAKQKGKAASNTHSQADEAADEAGGAVRSAADSVADGAQYVKDRFTAAPTGNTRKDVGDEAREAKGWFFSKKNKAKDEVQDQADQTSSWLGGKKEQAKDEADHQTNKASGWFGQRREEADDQADRAGNYVSRKSRDASNEANHQANKASGWFGQKKEDAKDAAEDSKDYLSRKSQGARDEADHQANKASGWFGQKKEDAKDAAEDSRDYLSRKSQGARDEADHQAHRAKGWLGRKSEEAEDAAERTGNYISDKAGDARDEARHQANKASGWFGARRDEAEDQADRAGNYASRKSRDARDSAEDQGRSARGWFNNKADEAEDTAEDVGNDLGAAARQAKDKLSNAGQYVADRFTANPSGNNRRGRDLDDEAHEAKERTKGWFGSKKEQAEDTAEDAKGFFGNRQEDAKDQAHRTKGWFNDKADEAQQGDSNDLGEAFRDAKDSVKSGASYVRDRFTADPSGERSGRRDSGSYGRGSYEQGYDRRDPRSLTERARDSLPSRRSVELNSREEYDYSNGLIPSNTEAEMSKFGRRR